MKDLFFAAQERNDFPSLRPARSITEEIGTNRIAHLCSDFVEQPVTTLTANKLNKVVNGRGLKFEMKLFATKDLKFIAIFKGAIDKEWKLSGLYFAQLFS